MSGRLDARGLRCPWPVLRLAAAMREADELTVTVDDPAAPDEIATLAANRNWDLKRTEFPGTFQVTKRAR